MGPVENSHGHGEDGQTKSSNLKEANGLVITPEQSPFSIWGATDLPLRDGRANMSKTRPW